MQVIRAMQEHIAGFTGVNEAFEVIFNAAVAGDMNLAKVSTKTLPATSIMAG